MSLFSFETILKRKYGLVYSTRAGSVDGAPVTAVNIKGQAPIASMREDIFFSVYGAMRDTARAHYTALASYPSAPVSTTQGSLVTPEVLRANMAALGPEVLASLNLLVLHATRNTDPASKAWKRLYAGLTSLDEVSIDDGDVYSVFTHMHTYMSSVRTGLEPMPRIPIGTAATISGKAALLLLADERPVPHSVDLRGLNNAQRQFITMSLTDSHEAAEDGDTLVTEGYLDIFAAVGGEAGTLSVDLTALPEYTGPTVGSRVATSPGSGITTPSKVCSSTASTPSARTSCASEEDTPSHAAVVNTAVAHVEAYRSKNVNALSEKDRELAHTGGPEGAAALATISRGAASKMLKQVPSVGTPQDCIVSLANYIAEQTACTFEAAAMAAAGKILACKGQFIFTADTWKKK